MSGNYVGYVKNTRKINVLLTTAEAAVANKKN